MMCRWTEHWSFSTKQYRVVFWTTPEDVDPRDCFEFPEDIEAIERGDVEWFAARVTVEKNGRVIGEDHLGGCSYNSVGEFYTGHRDAGPLNRNCSIMRAARGENVIICHYFPDMVRQAIADARETLGSA